MTVVVFELDGTNVEAEPDETIWQVAQRVGTDIPVLCFRDAPGYRPDGNCRACMVEIDGERVLAASCMRASRLRHARAHLDCACREGARPRP